MEGHFAEMSLIVFYDSETSGKADFKSAPDAPHQPRLVQLGMVLSDDAGNELGSVDLIVRPEGFEIPSEAAAIHGITTERALKEGIPLASAMGILKAWMGLASLRIAHNSDYDDFVLTGESLRTGLGCGLDQDRFCTMRAMEDVCKIPGYYGKWKWPTLSEAHQHAFGKDFDAAHSAIADVRACRDIYFWLQRRDDLDL